MYNDMILVNLPNILTLLRGVFVFIGLYFFLCHHPFIGLVWFLIAGVSDYIDGRIARRFGWESEFGKLMDPIMDKVLVLTGFFLLAWRELLPWWMVGLISIREIGITGLRFFWIRQGRGVVPALLSGKVKTTVQMITVFLGLFVIVLGVNWAKNLVLYLGWISLFLSLYSGYIILRMKKCDMV